MSPTLASALLALWWILQALGIAATVAARYSTGARQRGCQASYFACLFSIGTAAVAWAAINPSACMAGGATLAVMLLGAVWDSSPSRAAT